MSKIPELSAERMAFLRRISEELLAHPERAEFEGSLYLALRLSIAFTMTGATTSPMAALPLLLIGYAIGKADAEGIKEVEMLERMVKVEGEEKGRVD